MHRRDDRALITTRISMRVKLSLELLTSMYATTN